MKFRIIVSDPPWFFNDKLTMSDIKRGAESNYSILDTEKLCDIPVAGISEDDSVLCLWVPSSLLPDGLKVMESWGFKQKQVWVWVKTKKSPFRQLIKDFSTALHAPWQELSGGQRAMLDKLMHFDLNSTLLFNMGRLFRQTHEICLIGTRGSPYKHIVNKSQRSAGLGSVPDVPDKHSAKTEMLQDRLELMFGQCSRLEMFARRSRIGWSCIGLECPDTPGEDIFDSIRKLADG